MAIYAESLDAARDISARVISGRVKNCANKTNAAVPINKNAQLSCVKSPSPEIVLARKGPIAAPNNPDAANMVVKRPSTSRRATTPTINGSLIFIKNRNKQKPRIKAMGVGR